MTQEDKNILLKDLCARLPYGVKCYAYQFKIDGNDCECCGTLAGINNGYFHLSDRTPVNGGKTYNEHYLEVKPYLRLMSSMTEEERKEYESFFSIGEYSCGGSLYGEEYEYIADDYDDVTQSVSLIDWLNAHHFDYRGLIPMELALEAPEDMYKTE